MRYLIDTCVWIDFFNDRISKSGRELGLAANNFIYRLILNKDEILYSEITIHELRKNYTDEEIMLLLGLLKRTGILKLIESNQNERKAAKELSINRKLPFADCLIAIQAKTHDAKVISQDKHLLEDLKDVACSLRPEDLT
jgi:predicted nucleic acid-binding protein